MPKDPKDSSPAIFAAERQEKIAALVTSRGRIHLDELASVFEVSQPTLRKDLIILARQGLVKRTHGGALSTRAPAERDIMTRFVQNVDFARVCQPRDVDIIVTDSANEDLRRICKDHEIRLEEVST
jgi:DeoR/GlpR family transcriptional regulator of sugar metabolism